MGHQIASVMHANSLISNRMIISNENSSAKGQTGPLAPLPNPDPLINNYNLQGFSYIPYINPESNFRNLVGEFIYEYVEMLVGEERAPMITGMLLDLSLDQIKSYLYDFSNLFKMTGEANAVLNQLKTNTYTDS